jgi:hypothetical protein
LIWPQHLFGVNCLPATIVKTDGDDAMPFIRMLPHPGMNYTFNRPLLDGTSPPRLKELSAISPRIKDYDSWHAVWLKVAKKAEAEKRHLDAASYYHGAEFYLPTGRRSAKYASAIDGVVALK